MNRLALLVFLLVGGAAQAAPPTDQSKWALGVSLRDPGTSSLWRIGPRFTCGLTLGKNVFTHISDLNLWTLDFNYRLTMKVFHNRSKETSWFTFLEAGHSLYEVDYTEGRYARVPDPKAEELSYSDSGKTAISTGIGIAWSPHSRLGCFIRWGILFEYREGIRRYNQSWIELDRLRLTGFWML